MKWTFLFLTLIIFTSGISQKVQYFSSVKLPSSISESSGLVKASDTSFYTINDGGNASILFEINLKGKIIRKIKINAPNHDWEDLSLDEKGNLYIGDVGNNLNSRGNLTLLKISKSALKQSSITPTRYLYAYSDQKSFPPPKSKLYYDCEAFVVRHDTLFLFTKNRTEPFDGKIKMYALSLKSGSKVAQLWNVIDFCANGWYSCSVTSADFNYSSKELLLLSYSQVVRIRNFGFVKNEKVKLELIKVGKVEQFESICFGKNGFIYLTSEVQKFIGGGYLHQIKIK